MNLIDSFIAIDLETTGLEKDKDRIVEVALCRYLNGQRDKEWVCLFNPEIEIRDFIVKLTGIPVNELANAPLFAAKSQEILDFIGELPLVAHNAPMDIAFLNKEIELCGHPKISNRVFDTLSLSRIAWSHVRNHRLENLAEELSLPQESAHRALPDARRCAALFIKAQETLAAQPPEVISALASLAILTPLEPLFVNIQATAPLFSGLPYQDAGFDDEQAPNPTFDQLFGSESPLLEWMPEFKSRPGQIQLAKASYNTLRDDSVLCAEAGTGSGKSLAYLSAAFSWLHTKKNSRIAIATASKALQEQLFKQEIPRLQALHGNKIKVAILKGRDNYLCPHRLQRILQNPLSLVSSDERVQLMALIPWAATTQTGDISENSGFSAQRQAFLWRRVNGDPRSCNSTCCGQQCFAEKARQRANLSQIILVNHALLLRDIAMDFGLLPQYDRLIVDEAHRFEDQARQQFSRQIWFYRLRHLTQQLQHPFDSQIGRIAQSINQSGSEQEKQLLALCQQELGDLERQLHKLFLKIGKQLRKRPKVQDKIRYQQGLALDFNASPEPFLSSLRSANQILQNIQSEFAPEQWRELHAEIASCQQALRELESDAMSLCNQERTDTIHWVEEWANPHTLKLVAAPIEPAQLIAQKLGQWIKGTIFISATLSIKGKFDYFVERMHLKDWKKHKVQFFLQESPFKMDEQREIVLFKGLDNPNEQNFNQQLSQVLSQSLPGVDASVLVLFTSINALNQAHKELSPALAGEDRILLAQHIDGNIDNLMEQFRRRKGSVLLGTQVFWEGIDFPGKQLEVLVIAKLPFPNPNDPVVAARSEELKKLGRNAFREYLIPEAQMQLRQGIGRLIRTPEDRGIVILMDPRLSDGNYAKTFTGLWNHKQKIANNSQELKEILEQSQL